jgi:hypothetical protein
MVFGFSPYPMDKGLTRGTILESGDGLVVGCVVEFNAMLGEAANVVTVTLALLLPAMAKFTRVAKPRVGTLEVPYDGVPKLGPVVDPPSRVVLEPGTCRVGEVQRDAFDDEQIVGRSIVVAGKVIVLKPYARVGLPVVLCDSGQGTIPSWGLQRERWCRKPVDLDGQASDSDSGPHRCRNGPRASVYTPFAAGVRHPTGLGSSSSHVSRMRLEPRG